VLAVDRRQHRTPASEYADCDLTKPEQITSLTNQIGADWNILAHVAGNGTGRAPNAAGNGSDVRGADCDGDAATVSVTGTGEARADRDGNALPVR
jgi:hypothetical protein